MVLTKSCVENVEKLFNLFCGWMDKNKENLIFMFFPHAEYLTKLKPALRLNSPDFFFFLKNVFYLDTRANAK